MTLANHLHRRLFSADLSWIAVCGLLAMFIVSCSAGPAGQVPQEPDAGKKSAQKAETPAMIHVSSKEELEKVIQAGKPLFIDFYADWCGPCRRLAPEVEKLSAAYSGRIAVVKINVDKAEELAKEYGVSSIPAIFVLKDGKVTDKAMGFRPYAELEAMVKPVLVSP